MSKEKEIDWDKVLHGEPTEKPTEAQLIKKIKQMKMAADSIPRGTVLIQFFAVLMTIAYGGIMVSQITSTYAIYLFVLIAPTITIFIHYILVIGKLRRLTCGE